MPARDVVLSDVPLPGPTQVTRDERDPGPTASDTGRR